MAAGSRRARRGSALASAARGGLGERARRRSAARRARASMTRSLGLDPLAGAQQQRALDDVLELAAIAGPAVRHQPVERGGRREGQRQRRPATWRSSSAAAIARMSSRRARSGASVERKDVEAPVEVGAEAAGGDFGGEVAVGAGDDADVDRLGPDRADRQDFASPAARAAAWPGARSGISAISSSSRVPPSAARNRPSPSRLAPVKLPLRWPNSIASSIVSGSAAQLTAMNGPLRARRAGVDVAGDAFLAGAGLAEHQHGGVAGGDPRRRSRACAALAGSPQAGRSARADQLGDERVAEGHVVEAEATRRAARRRRPASMRACRRDRRSDVARRGAAASLVGGEDGGAGAGAAAGVDDADGEARRRSARPPARDLPPPPFSLNPIITPPVP